MADPTEVIPLLVVVLLLLGAQGGDVDAVAVTLDGDRTVTAVEDVLVVGGGTVDVPAGERVNGSLYVVGGDARVAGTVDGDVVQLAGNLTVAGSATVTGELQLYAGRWSVAPGATVGRRTAVEDVVPAEPSPVRAASTLALRALALALAGWVLARRDPALLANVGAAVTDHPVVSATVGLLAGATGVALVVFMAITLLLLPVSVLGVVVGFVVVSYAYVVFGYLLGRRLPVGRVDLASAAGVVAVVLAVEALGRIPVVGALVELGLVVTGAGAVLLTYFGLQRFEPVALPE